MTPIDTIIHMGAGQCSELDDYITLQPRQLLLVEVDPQLARDLRGRIQGLDQAQVNCIAIAGEPGQATLYRYNLPEANSLHPASGLMRLFPGLKLVEQQQVKTVSPVTLLEPLQLEPVKENLLVIDLPGEELPVLKALLQSQHLELFSQLHLYCGREPLYEGSEPATLVLEWLRKVGYDMVAEDDSQDPDRPCWSFRRNALQLHNRALQKQLDQLLEKNKEILQHVDDLQSQAIILTHDRDSQAKLAGELDVKLNDLIEMGNKRQTQLEQLAQERDEKANLIANLNIQLEQVDQTKTEKEKLAADRQSELEATIKTHDEQTKLVADLQAQVGKLIQDHEAKSKLIGERESRVNDLTNLASELQLQLDQLTIARDEQEKLAAKKRDDQAKLLADLNGQLEQVKKAKAEADKLAEDLQSKLKATIKARDEQTKMVSDLQAQIEKLTQDRDTQSKLAGDRETRINELTKQANEQKAQLDQLTKARDEQEKLVTKEQDEQAKLLADVNGQLEQIKKARAEADKLATVRQSKLEATIQARDEQTKMAADLQAQIEKLTQARDAQGKLAGDRETKINELTQQANEWKVQMDNVTKERDMQVQQLAEAQKQIGQLMSDLLMANQTANLATKLQILRESDLQDLQQQYKTSIETQNSQHKLLAQLEDRLNIAAQYFHQLQGQQVLTSKESEPLPLKRSNPKLRKLKNKK